MKTYQSDKNLALPCLCTIMFSLGDIQAAEQHNQPERLNIIFILADDLGWKDLSYNGSRLYETPNIDNFAKEGMVFNCAYAASPLSSPTRASILTGLYPARIGITFPDCHFPEEILEKGLETKPDSSLKWIGARSVTRLKTEYYTLAEALKSTGYHTGHFGKWHLGNQPYGPLQHGFDITFPNWPWAPGPGPYIAPWRWGVNGTEDKGTDGENIEERTANEAIKFIRENKDEPFFLNYWSWSVHGPHQTTPELLEKYNRKINKGQPQQNPYYAGMIETMDKNVGKIFQAVKDLGLEKNTLIVFVSDNGGIHYPSRQVLLDTPVTSNDPLRGGKATIYDGGTRVPCIVYWPGVTKPGTVSEQVISSVDWYPTLLEITDTKCQPSQKFDGISIVPALKGKSLKRKAIYCHYPQGDGIFTEGYQPSTYVREGNWKLIRFFCDNPDQSDRFELYNIKDDIGEQINLMDKFPRKANRLKKMIDQFLEDTEAVIPVPNPNYHASK